MVWAMVPKLTSASSRPGCLCSRACQALRSALFHVSCCGRRNRPDRPWLTPPRLIAEHAVGGEETVGVGRTVHADQRRGWSVTLQTAVAVKLARPSWPPVITLTALIEHGHAVTEFIASIIMFSLG